MNNIIEIIKQKDNPTIVIDFDHTITTFSSDTSIGVFNKVLGNNYLIKKKRIDKLVEETNSKIKMYYLWTKKLNLLKRYNAFNSINKAVKYFKIRDSFYPLYEYCKKNNIEMIICSAGYKPLVEEILKRNNIKDVTLIANYSNFKVITPFNKYKFINKKIKNPILIGDYIGDSNMSMSKNKTTIGICNDLKDYNKFVSTFDNVILDKFEICNTYHTSKTEIGICKYGDKKYFYKKKNNITKDEKKGYDEVSKYYQVSKYRIELEDYIIYEYIKDFSVSTLNDYLYGKEEKLHFKTIEKQYNLSLKNTLTLMDENKCESKKYFYDRLPVIENNLSNLLYKYLTINDKKYDLEEILKDIIKNIKKRKKVYAFITQGDPTDTNITTTGYFTDFENGGYNSILSEISINFISLFSHGRYFYPKYNKKAYSVNKSIIKKYNKFGFDINYNIKNNEIFIEYFKINLPKKNSLLIKKFIKLYLDNEMYDTYSKDFKDLKYYICMRLLTPIDIEKMDEKDKVVILSLIAIIYEEVNDLKSLLSVMSIK